MPQTVQQLIDAGLAHHSAGRIPEAEAIYRQVLQIDANCPAAYHLLGVASSQRGNKREAVELIRRAIALNPNVPEFHSNLALVFIEDNRPDLALASAKRAVELNARYPDALNHVGNALRMLGRPEESIAALQEALHIRPDFSDALQNLSLVLMESGRIDEAVQVSQRATANRQGDPKHHLHLGRVLHKQKQHEQAIAEYRKVLATDFMPAEAHNNLGAVYQDMGRVDEAIASYRKALEIEPAHAGAFNNLGYAMSTIGRVSESIENYLKSVALRPDAPDTLNNLANAYRDNLEVDRALDCYRKALFHSPNHIDAHWNRSLLLLLLGRFEEGWHEYEWRWIRFPNERRGFVKPQWDGEDIDGKSILLHAEQGLGDTLQFVRYAPLVAERGATVYLEVQPALEPLLRSMPGVSRVIAKGDVPPDFDLQCPLLSIPYAMRTTLETIPAKVPYIVPDAGLVRLWAKRLENDGRKKIGLAWAGSTIHARDRERSISLEKLAALFDVPNMQFVSLQKQLPARDQADVKRFGLLDATSDLRDFADTAALVENLDLVISVDTAAVHLAGAMGKPVWVMLPRNPDWRWLLDREDTPWYPTARLYRQTDTLDWDGVIARIQRDLGRL